MRHHIHHDVANLTYTCSTCGEDLTEKVKTSNAADLAYNDRCPGRRMHDWQQDPKAYMDPPKCSACGVSQRDTHPHSHCPGPAKGDAATLILDTHITLIDAVDKLNTLSSIIHERNVAAGWWTDRLTGQSLLGKDEQGRDRRNVPELLCLVHSEVSEAMEGYRKGLMDDKLPHRPMFEVELADVFIRIFDIAGAHKLDLAGAVLEKLEFNAHRPDHKIENRNKPGGKAF